MDKTDPTELGNRILSARAGDSRPLSEILDETSEEKVGPMLRVIVKPGVAMYWPAISKVPPFTSIRFEGAKYYRELGEWLWVGRQ